MTRHNRVLCPILGRLHVKLASSAIRKHTGLGRGRVQTIGWFGLCHGPNWPRAESGDAGSRPSSPEWREPGSRSAPFGLAELKGQTGGPAAPPLWRPTEFGRFARQRRAGISAQGSALGKQSRNPNPPCKGGSTCFSPKGDAHRMPSPSASGVLGVLPERIPAGDAPETCGKGDLRPYRAQEPSKTGFPRVLPWAGMLRAFSAGSMHSRGAARVSQTPPAALAAIECSSSHVQNSSKPEGRCSRRAAETCRKTALPAANSRAR
jgi:hypothetical protein